MDRCNSGSVLAEDDRIVMLDGMRGFAAMFVVLFHFSQIAGETSLFARGYLAVDFFFMLSGFVLVPIFEAERTANLELAMLTTRVLRFWPLVAIGAMLGALVHAADPALSGMPGLLTLHLLFAPSDDPRLPIFALNQPQWSLWCELLLNGLHLAMLSRLRTGAVLALACGCWLIAAIGCGVHGTLDLGAGPTVLAFGIFRATSAYAFGIVLRRSAAGQARCAAMPWWSAPVVLGLPARFADPLVALMFAAVIATAASAKIPPRLAGVCRWLGALSFPLYAIHYPVLEIPQIWLSPPGHDTGFGLRCLSFASAIGLAWILARTPLARGIKLPMHRASQLRQPI